MGTSKAVAEGEQHEQRVDRGALGYPQSGSRKASPTCSGGQQRSPGYDDLEERRLSSTDRRWQLVSLRSPLGARPRNLCGRTSFRWRSETEWSHNVLWARATVRTTRMKICCCRRACGIGCRRNIWRCAGINRCGVEDERASRGRSSDPLGPEFCVGCCEASGEA